MTNPADDVDDRARAAAAGLRRAVTLTPPDLTALVRASRVRKVGRAAFLVAVLVAVGAVTFGAASVVAPESMRLVTGLILVVLVALTWLLCAHAGGHAWFVPLPALILAVLWAVTVSGRQSGAAWWLAAMSAAAAALGVMVGSTALRQQLRGSWLATPTLAGTSGTAVTALNPVGVVRVASETWTANSLSGSLPAGAPVHVVRVDGVRLDVWSEAGTVPDHRALETEEEQA
jgi:membrane-bound ClpP family serine protease